MVRVKGAQLVVRALEDEGVSRVFGIPGTHNIELWDAIESSPAIEPVLVTHECGAAFMADGLARSSAEIGVLVVVPGAGVTHALSGVAEAMMDNVPLVVIASGIRNDTGAAFQLHAIDQLAVLKPVTKSAVRIEAAETIYPCLREAFAESRRAPAGPVAVEIPANLMMLTQTVPEPSWSEQRIEVAPADRDVLEASARLLTEAVQPVLYVGRGAESATESVVRLAERLGAPVVTTFQGKGVFPERHPLWLWTGFGNQAPPAVRRIVDGCDAMLAIGCRFSEVATGSYGVDPPARLIHVDVSPDVLARNYPAEIVAVCDAQVFVDGLLDLIEGARPWAKVAGEINVGQHSITKRWAKSQARPGTVHPYVFFRALQRHCRDDAVFTTDSGNGTFLAAEHLRLERPGRFLAPVDFSCMGYAVPAAVGAAMGNPGRDVVALPGDGAFLMTGLELLTGGAYGCGPLVCVLRDGMLGQIAQFQKIPLNRQTSSILPDYSVQGIASAVHAPFFRIVQEHELDTVLPAALGITRQGSPVVIEVMLDTKQLTYFTKGVLKTNFRRMPWSERLRLIGRAIARRL